MSMTKEPTRGAETGFNNYQSCLTARNTDAFQTAGGGDFDLQHGQFKRQG